MLHHLSRFYLKIKISLIVTPCSLVHNKSIDSEILADSIHVIEDVSPLLDERTVNRQRQTKLYFKPRFNELYTVWV
jgi:hypothetical protein